jgi:hypothetical protein
MIGIPNRSKRIENACRSDNINGRASTPVKTPPIQQKGMGCLIKIHFDTNYFAVTCYRCPA